MHEDHFSSSTRITPAWATHRRTSSANLLRTRSNCSNKSIGRGDPKHAHGRRGSRQSDRTSQDRGIRACTRAASHRHLLLPAIVLQSRALHRSIRSYAARRGCFALKILWLHLLIFLLLELLAFFTPICRHFPKLFEYIFFVLKEHFAEIVVIRLDEVAILSASTTDPVWGEGSVIVGYIDIGVLKGKSMLANPHLDFGREFLLYGTNLQSSHRLVEMLG
jgi:hypothetical protein